MSLPTRRALLAALAALPAARAFAQTPELTETVALPVDATRAVEVTVLHPPREPVGVALFGHGLGGHVSNYPALTQGLVGAGWIVMAPMHVDSLRHPQREAFDMRASFGARLADWGVVGKLAEQAAPGMPVVAAGHSYGSLFAAMLGGALDKAAPVRNPAVKAVLACSTPGVIPGLVYPGAYASLAVPMMTVTGDKDVVEGFVADWRDHLVPFETSPAGGNVALVFAGGDHSLMGGERPAGAQFPRAMAAAGDFLAAKAAGDAAAAGRLAGLVSGDGLEVRRR